MSELNDKLKQLSEILGRDDIPEGLLQLFSSVIDNKNVADNKKQANPSLPSVDLTTSNEDLLPEQETIRSEPEKNLKLKSIVDKLRNQNNDPRVSLLKSVRQFVGPARKNSIDKCIKFLNFVEISQFMDMGKD